MGENNEGTSANFQNGHTDACDKKSVDKDSPVQHF